jgi:hypothetical protein
VFLAGFEPIAIQFKEKNPDHKSGALVPVDKRMVADNAGCVCGSQVDKVGRLGTGEVLLGCASADSSNP